jgi:hypothetical protein
VIEMDISGLDIGDTLKASDLPEIEGVTYLVESEQPLVTVLLAAVLVEEVEEVLEGELEEGEEGEEGEEDAEEDGEG